MVKAGGRATPAPGSRLPRSWVGKAKKSAKKGVRYAKKAAKKVARKAKKTKKR